MLSWQRPAAGGHGTPGPGFSAREVLALAVLLAALAVVAWNLGTGGAAPQQRGRSAVAAVEPEARPDWPAIGAQAPPALPPVALPMPLAVTLEPPVASRPGDALVGRWQCALVGELETSRDLQFEASGLFESRAGGKRCDGTWRAVTPREYRLTGACAAPAVPGGRPLLALATIEGGSLRVQDAGVRYTWSCQSGP